jgi:hypothetical protein
MLCILPLAGCGKKGDPSAPRAVVPAKIKNLSAHPQGRSIVVSWNIPKKNTDGSELLDLKGFKILRSVSAFDKECRECPKRFSLLYEIDYETYMMGKSHSITIEYSDSDLNVRTIYTYSVVSYNAAHQLSPHARTEEIFWDVPSMPPGNLQAKLQEKSVILSWVEPTGLEDGAPLQGVVGYNLYRRGPGEVYTPTPLNHEPITTLACRDRGVEVDQDYFYTLRSIRKIEETFIESEGCEEVAVSTTDFTPPAVPTGLIAIPITTGIVLKWNESKVSDLKGYNLYRKTGDAADFIKVTPAPLPIASYLDTSVEDGQTYTYVVTALDDALKTNESNPSTAVTIHYNQ